MALEKAQFGDGAQVVECRRKALDNSDDLACEVRSVCGADI